MVAVRIETVGRATRAGRGRVLTMLLRGGKRRRTIWGEFIAMQISMEPRCGSYYMETNSQHRQICSLK